MKHARDDYAPIQDPRGLIPEDEPVFLLRGQDKVAWRAVEAWARMAEEVGAAPDIISAAMYQSAAMLAWARKCGARIPDMPEPAGQAPRASAPINSDRWLHVKTGGTYKIIDEGGVQSEVPLVDLDRVIIYRSEKDGTLWARRATEFFDGRFVPADDTKTPAKIDEGRDGLTLTREMIDAGVEVLYQKVDLDFRVPSDRDTVIDIWHAMRSARQNSAKMHKLDGLPADHDGGFTR